MRAARNLGRTWKSLTLGAATVAALAALPSTAEAQEIQITGPLAGAPAVRKLRLHRQGRFELQAGANFTLLDEFQRTIMPTLGASYFFTDWFGVGLWGGYGFQVQTGLAGELQRVAVEGRNCAANPTSTGCRLTAVNITRAGTNADGSARTGTLGGDQFGAFQWVLAPQLTFTPFRGKVALFAAAFVDTDVSFFVGPAIVGLKQRRPCGLQDDDATNLGPCADTFALDDAVTVAPTFGLQLNFYPLPFMGFGGEFRALPYAWNTSGFDVRGSQGDGRFPDNAISGADSEFRFNTMASVFLSFQLPPKMKITD
jgi:hypothetical protein